MPQALTYKLDPNFRVTNWGVERVSHVVTRSMRSISKNEPMEVKRPNYFESELSEDEQELVHTRRKQKILRRRRSVSGICRRIRPKDSIDTNINDYANPSNTPNKLLKRRYTLGSVLCDGGEICLSNSIGNALSKSEYEYTENRIFNTDPTSSRKSGTSDKIVLSQNRNMQPSPFKKCSVTNNNTVEREISQTSDKLDPNIRVTNWGVERVSHVVTRSMRSISKNEPMEVKRPNYFESELSEDEQELVPTRRKQKILRRRRSVSEICRRIRPKDSIDTNINDYANPSNTPNKLLKRRYTLGSVLCDGGEICLSNSIGNALSKSEYEYTENRIFNTDPTSSRKSRTSDKIVLSQNRNMQPSPDKKCSVTNNNTVERERSQTSDKLDPNIRVTNWGVERVSHVVTRSMRSISKNEPMEVKRPNYFESELSEDEQELVPTRRKQKILRRRRSVSEICRRNRPKDSIETNINDYVNPSNTPKRLLKRRYTLGSVLCDGGEICLSNSIGNALSKSEYEYTENRIFNTDPTSSRKSGTSDKIVLSQNRNMQPSPDKKCSVTNNNTVEREISQSSDKLDPNFRVTNCKVERASPVVTRTMRNISKNDILTKVFCLTRKKEQRPNYFESELSEDEQTLVRTRKKQKIRRRRRSVSGICRRNRPKESIDTNIHDYANPSNTPKKLLERRYTLGAVLCDGEEICLSNGIENVQFNNNSDQSNEMRCESNNSEIQDQVTEVRCALSKSNYEYTQNRIINTDPTSSRGSRTSDKVVISQNRNKPTRLSMKTMQPSPDKQCSVTNNNKVERSKPSDNNNCQDVVKTKVNLESAENVIKKRRSRIPTKWCCCDTSDRDQGKSPQSRVSRRKFLNQKSSTKSDNKYAQNKDKQKLVSDCVYRLKSSEVEMSKETSRSRKKIKLAVTSSEKHRKLTSENKAEPRDQTEKKLTMDTSASNETKNHKAGEIKRNDLCGSEKNNKRECSEKIKYRSSSDKKDGAVKKTDKVQRELRNSKKISHIRRSQRDNSNTTTMDQQKSNNPSKVPIACQVSDRTRNRRSRSTSRTSNASADVSLESVDNLTQLIPIADLEGARGSRIAPPQPDERPHQTPYPASRQAQVVNTNFQSDIHIEVISPYTEGNLTQDVKMSVTTHYHGNSQDLPLTDQSNNVPLNYVDRDPRCISQRSNPMCISQRRRSARLALSNAASGTADDWHVGEVPSAVSDNHAQVRSGAFSDNECEFVKKVEVSELENNSIDELILMLANELIQMLADIVPPETLEEAGPVGEPGELPSADTVGSNKRPTKQSELTEIIDIAKTIASKISGRNEKNQSFAEYVVSSLNEMNEQEAKEKRRKIVSVLES